MASNHTPAPFAPLIDIASYAMGATFVFMTSFADTLAALNASLTLRDQDAAPAPDTAPKK